MGMGTTVFLLTLIMYISEWKYVEKQNILLTIHLPIFLLYFSTEIDNEKAENAQRTVEGK